MLSRKTFVTCHQIIDMKGRFSGEICFEFCKYDCLMTVCSVFVFVFLNVQAEETETCPLTFTKSTNNEPLILFLIDVSNLRFVIFSAGVLEVCMTVL